MNQMTTGTVSCHPILNILERRLGYLWVCLVCNDDELMTNDHIYQSYKTLNGWMAELLLSFSQVADYNLVLELNDWSH
jgi:hypothetical protein